MQISRLLWERMVQLWAETDAAISQTANNNNLKPISEDFASSLDLEVGD